MSSEGENLEKISKAIDLHDSSCEFKISSIEMNPFEIDRLGWDSIKGIPLIPNSDIGTGRFKIICQGLSQDLNETVEAISKSQTQYGRQTVEA